MSEFWGGGGGGRGEVGDLNMMEVLARIVCGFGKVGYMLLVDRDVDVVNEGEYWKCMCWACRKVAVRYRGGLMGGE